MLAKVLKTEQGSWDAMLPLLCCGQCLRTGRENGKLMKCQATQGGEPSQGRMARLERPAGLVQLVGACGAGGG